MWWRAFRNAPYFPERTVPNRALDSLPNVKHSAHLRAGDGRRAGNDRGVQIAQICAERILTGTRRVPAQSGGYRVSSGAQHKLQRVTKGTVALSLDPPREFG